MLSPYEDPDVPEDPVYQLTTEIAVKVPSKNPAKVVVLSNEKSVDGKVMDSLFDSIRDSRKEIINMQRENMELKESEKIWKFKYDEKVKEIENIESRLSRYFGDTQMEIIHGKDKAPWDNETLEKMAALKENIGERNLEMMSKHYFPAPHPSTIRRHLKDFKFKAGLQTLNMRVLKRKSDIMDLHDHQKKILIGFDEKQIVPGVKFDPSTRQRVGFATLDSTENQKAKNPNNLATHGQLYLAMGLNPRFKEIIAFDYTSNATDPESTKKRIFEIIIQTEKESGMKVMGLVMDMGASNMSFLKSIGIILRKINPVYHFQHPQDPTRKIFIILDPVHFIKNLACGIRNHDAIFSDEIINENNLSSSTVKFQDILDLHEKQKDEEIKFAPKLTHEVLFPTNFEKMQEDIAYNLISPEVSQGIDIIYEDNPKKNTTSFFLELLNRLKEIYTNDDGWSIDRWDDYLDDIEFLKYMAKKIFPNIKFQMTRGSLKSVEGAIVGIYSSIELRRDLFESGAEIVYPKHFLNNAVENNFAQVTNRYPKPDAIQFQRALKGISLKNYQKPVKGSSYRFEKTNEDTPTVNFIPMIKEMAQNQNEKEAEDDIYEIPEITLREHISETDLYPSNDQVKLSAFYKNILKIVLENIHATQNCPQCHENFQSVDDDEENFHFSTECLNFFFLLEHCYREVKAEVPLGSKYFEDTFKITASSIKYCNHCEEIQDVFIEKFLRYRLPLSIPSRVKHMINRYSSKSISK
jgi:hypothetical protein